MQHTCHCLLCPTKDCWMDRLYICAALWMSYSHALSFFLRMVQVDGWVRGCGAVGLSSFIATHVQQQRVTQEG